MKKEKVEQDEKKEVVEVIEIENFEVSKTGSLADDLMKFENVKDIKIENKEVPDIEVQEIYIRETGNYLNLQENFINIPILYLITLLVRKIQNRLFLRINTVLIITKLTLCRYSYICYRFLHRNTPPLHYMQKYLHLIAFYMSTQCPILVPLTSTQKSY